MKKIENVEQSPKPRASKKRDLTLKVQSRLRAGARGEGR